MSEYENLLTTTIGAWKMFRDAVGYNGSSSCSSLAKEEKRFLLSKLEEFAETYKSRHNHMTGRGFAREIDSSHYRNLERVIRNVYGSFFDFIVESGIWDGEPLIEKTILNPNGPRKVLVSERYPDVIFSRTGNDSDISWFPRLPDPYSKDTAEIAGILLTSSQPNIPIDSKDSLAIPATINLKVQFPEVIYLTKYVMPLLSNAFHVHPDFFNFWGIKTEKGPYSEYTLSQYGIQSQMMGSYFQNLIGIYEVRNGFVRKRPPKLQLDKEGLVKGILNTAAMVNKENIELMGKKFLLELFKESTNLECSGPRPRLQYPLTEVMKTNDKFYAVQHPMHSRGYKIGTEVFIKNGELVGKIVDVVKGESWERDYIPERLIIELYEDIDLSQELFPVTHYSLSVKGGQKTVRRTVEEYFNNPYRILRYLKRLKKIPEHFSEKGYIQEFVFSNWKNDIDTLVDELKIFIRDALPSYSQIASKEGMHALSVNHMKKFHSSAYFEGKEKFGTYREALKAAGINTSDISDALKVQRRLDNLIRFRLRSCGCRNPARDLRWAYYLLRPELERRLEYHKSLDPNKILIEKPELENVLKQPVYNRVVSVILDVLGINFRDYFVESNSLEGRSIGNVTKWEREMLERCGWKIVEEEIVRTIPGMLITTTEKIVSLKRIN